MYQVVQFFCDFCTNSYIIYKLYYEFVQQAARAKPPRPGRTRLPRRYGRVHLAALTLGYTRLPRPLGYEFYPGPDTSFFFSSTYVELYRTSTCCGRDFFRACVKTRNSFPVHHGGRRLWPLPSPMARRHPNQAHMRHPHTMGDAVCAWFGLNPRGGRVVSC